MVPLSYAWVKWSNLAANKAKVYPLVRETRLLDRLSSKKQPDAGNTLPCSARKTSFHLYDLHRLDSESLRSSCCAGDERFFLRCSNSICHPLWASVS